MRAILVRVGIDDSYGNWNAPIDPESNEFVYVPIPEDDRVVANPLLRTTYDDHCDELDRFSRRHGVDVSLPERLHGVGTHHDPDFGHLTYGDIGTRRGKPITTLSSGDVLAFYAGLRPITPCEHKLIYAMIGIYEIDQVLRASDIEQSRHHENAHTRMAEVSPDHVVVRARPCVSGRFRTAVPIGSFRENAYRVLPEVLDAWGGLGVKNGYIHRSGALPDLSSPAQFMRWLDGIHPGFHAPAKAA